LISFRVLFHLQSVLTPIAFNYEVTIMTHKIGNIGADGNLPAELKTCQSFRAQVLPKVTFRVGGIFP
jgi:hypothetical protein